MGRSRSNRQGTFASSIQIMTSLSVMRSNPHVVNFSCSLTHAACLVLLSTCCLSTHVALRILSAPLGTRPLPRRRFENDVSKPVLRSYLQQHWPRRWWATRGSAIRYVRMMKHEEDFSRLFLDCISSCYVPNAYDPSTHLGIFHHLFLNEYVLRPYVG